MQQSVSIIEAAISDAVARRLRLDLVLKAVTAGTDTRLISGFLAVRADNTLVLHIPWTRSNKKVFVPRGWQVGMAFELEELWVQATTTVRDYCFLPLQAGPRVDAMVVDTPEEMIVRKRRTSPRKQLESSGHRVKATVWAGGEGNLTCAAQHGHVVDCSHSGLGVVLDAPLEASSKLEVTILLQTPARTDCLVLRGHLKHCTACEDGTWKAGFCATDSPERGEWDKLAAYVAGRS